MNRRTVVNIGIAVCVAATAGAAELQQPDGRDAKNHGFYVGFGYGITQLSTAGEQRDVSGIDFTFDTSADDLGGLAYAGYWLTDRVGLEIGTRGYGTVNVPFAFDDPHENRSGTGESEVSITGFNISLLLGFDITTDVQIVGRVGALSWKESFDSRFDIPGEPAINAELEQSGTGLSVGLGISYQFDRLRAPGWRLEARYEYAQLEDDDVGLASIGMSYDFIALFPDLGSEI